MQSLFVALKMIKVYNEVHKNEPLKQKKYLLFHAAGNPYLANEGLLRYYSKDLGFTMTYGIFPLMYPIPDVIDMIRSDIEEGTDWYMSEYNDIFTNAKLNMINI